jgi:hypothetical protein
MRHNLITALDELAVLHARIAHQLLEEFRGAYGIQFVIDINPMSAYALADVPPGYADGYTDKALESRATHLLCDISARVAEVMASFPAAGITARDFSVSARRTGLDGDLEGSIGMSSAVTGGLGAVFARRHAISLGERVICHEPVEFHVVGIVDDPAKVAGIEDAGNRGLEAGLRHLISDGLLLNQDTRRSAKLLEWLTLFPEAEGACHFSYASPVARLIGRSRHRAIQLYAPTGSGMVPHDNIVEYDRGNGFSAVTLSDAVPSRPTP